MPADPRAAADYWLELLATSHGASTLESLHDAIARYHLVNREGAPIVSVLRPSFVTASMLAIVEGTANTVAAAASAATRRVIDDRSFRLAIGFPAYMDEMAALDGSTGAASFWSRFDGLFDATGTIRFIELNTDPAGIHNDFEATQMLARTPAARELARRFPFTISDCRDRLVDALIESARALGRASTPVRVNYGIEPAGTALLSTPWLGHAASRGVALSFTELKTLEVRGDGVYAAGARIDLLALPVAALLRGGVSLRPLLEVVRRGQVRTLLGLSFGVFAGNKILFEALSDPAHAGMYDVDTQRVLRKHIPWTRAVRATRTTHDDRDIDLLPFIAAHREQLVLKPAGSFGGDGVVVGRTCDDSTWDRSLTLATKRPHVVQEYVASSPERFPMYVDGAVSERMCTADLNIFIWNGTTAGGASSRVGETIHNVKSGASVGGLFVLADS